MAAGLAFTPFARFAESLRAIKDDFASESKGSFLKLTSLNNDFRG